MTLPASNVPHAWAGPILRRVEPARFVLWLALSECYPIQLSLRTDDGYRHAVDLSPGNAQYRATKAGERLHYALLDVALTDNPLPHDRWVHYDIALKQPDGAWLALHDWASDCCYDGESSPGFVLHSRVQAA